MRPTLEEIQALLAARRPERPGVEYWQEFSVEFHRRQRERVAAQPGLWGLGSRLDRMLAQIGPAKWAYGAGLVYAALTVAFLLMPAPMDGDPPHRVPVTHQRVPAPGGTLEPQTTPPAPAKPVERPLPAANGEVF
jgi:hypothetical protein